MYAPRFLQTQTAHSLRLGETNPENKLETGAGFSRLRREID